MNSNLREKHLLHSFLTGIGTISLATIVHAQALERNPGSVDPILRHLPLEKERVRPDPTPSPNIPVVPGKRTVLLRASYEKPDGPRSPLILLRIPTEFFARSTSRPAEVFGLNLLLKYPSLSHVVELPHSCRGWCEGKIAMGLQSHRVGSVSSADGRIREILEDIGRQSAVGAPLISYTRIATPQDYDEAYDVIYNKRKDEGRYKQYFWRNGKDGSASEFAECLPKVPSPGCNFLISLPDQPRLQISYTHSMDLWSDRRKVQNAVVGFVRQLYEGEVER